MENKIKIVTGAEGILLHDNNIILGMQKEKRWYELEDGTRGAIIKTIGGSVESEDKGDRKKALTREIIEEIKNINNKNIEVSQNKIFSKTISMGELNPFDPNNKLTMNADFYFVKIKGKEFKPNDLPILVEIPIKEFLKFKLNVKTRIKLIEKYIILNQDFSFDLPEYFSFFLPVEAIDFLKKYEEKNCI